MTNIEEDSLKRVNIIIEKTKAYDNCVFPIGTRGEFGALYISDLKGLLSELETYKKIAKRLAKEILLQYPEMFNMVTVNNIEMVIDEARKEVENEQKQ